MSISMNNQPTEYTVKTEDLNHLIDSFKRLFRFSAEKGIPMAMVMGIIESLKMEVFMQQMDSYYTSIAQGQEARDAGELQ